MKDSTFKLSTGRRTNRVPYKEDDTTVLTEATTAQDNKSSFNKYCFRAEKDVAVATKQSKERRTYLPKIKCVGGKLPMWVQVADNVILCGKRFLHCQNIGNIRFREYIAAAIVLHFRYQDDKTYNKEYSLCEIVDKFKNYEWRKLENEGEFLTECEIQIKIRKAFNDRKKNLSANILSKCKNLPPADAEIYKQSVVNELESKLKVELDYFDYFHYHLLQSKPSSITHVTNEKETNRKSQSEVTLLC